MPDDSLSNTFSALADPTRRAILAALTDGPATVTEIAAPHAMSGPAISKHLRVLERAGLITRGREAQYRPATLAAEPLKEVVAWAIEFRAFWDESFVRLDDYLERMQEQGEARPPRSSGSTAPSGNPASQTGTTTSGPEAGDDAGHPDPEQRRTA